MLFFMATSLDPAEMIRSGADPWTTALVATGVALAMLVAAAIGLRLWHTQRFRPAGAAFVALELAYAGWTLIDFYREYLA